MFHIRPGWRKIGISDVVFLNFKDYYEYWCENKRLFEFNARDDNRYLYIINSFVAIMNYKKNLKRSANSKTFVK